MTKLTPVKQKKSVFSTAQIIALSFLAIIFFGALVLLLPFCNKGNLNFTDSLYLSTSAVCLTGLTTNPISMTLTAVGQVFFLMLIQAGALGITTITSLIFILIRRKMSYRERLVLQESLNQDGTKGVVRLAKNITKYMFACESVGFLILAPYMFIKNGTIGIWQAAFTTVSSFCNAGFDIFGTASNPFPSLMQYNSSPLFMLTVSALIIVGGMGFSVVANITYKFKSNKKLSLNTKTVLFFTAILLGIGTLFIFAVEFNGEAFKNMTVGEKLLNAFFQSVTSRTAGYASVDQATLSLPSKVMTMLFMFIGGAPASTAGGIKVTTVAVLFAVMVSGLKNRDEVTLFKHTISPRTSAKAISAVLIGMLIIVTVSITVLLIEKHTALANTPYYSLSDIIFETFSAFGTTGLSTGITPYLSTASKYIFMATMFFGRVGTITVGLLFFSTNNRQPFRYPEGSIMVG